MSKEGTTASDKFYAFCDVKKVELCNICVCMYMLIIEKSFVIENVSNLLYLSGA